MEPMDETRSASDQSLVSALQRLPRTGEPPAAIEEATVDELRRRGLLRPPAGGVVWRRVASAAALVMTFGAGFMTRAQPDSPVPTHLLMLFGAEVNDSVHAVRAAEYAEWARASNPNGRVVGGAPLRASASDVASSSEATGEIDSAMVGYFLVVAPDDAMARQLAEQCPHRKYGGQVRVRALRVVAARH
jgi:hypothetical protein